MRKSFFSATVSASLIGVLCAVVIWCLQPINDYLLRNLPVADTYLPTIGVAMIVILAFLVNPLLRWLLPSLALSFKQLALIFAMIIVACSATALIQTWPHSLAASNRAITGDPALVNLHAEMELPSSFYLDPIELGAETPVSSQLADELEPGNSIPWSAWLGPATTWGSMLAFCLLIMIGMALIVFPQWRDNERLPFPLLTVQQALIEPPAGGGRFPAIVRSRLFWAAAATVFLIYGFKGLHHHTGGAFPNFGLGWGLWDAFGSGMFGRVPWYVKSGRVIFIILGITYFVPSRVAFSLWMTVIFFSLYRVLGYQFIAPFHGDMAIVDYRNGATVGMGVVIIWLGRRQWAAVARAIYRPPRDDTDRRNRTAGLMFLVGCLGLTIWQLWAGNSLVYALLAVAIVVITSLVLARIVAETGIPTMGTLLGAGDILGLLPAGWLSAKAIYLTNAVDLVVGETSSKVSATVTALHGFGLDKEQGPRRHARLAKGFFLLVLVGLLVAGSVHLWMGYNFPGSLDGRRAIGQTQEIETAMHLPLKDFARGSWGDAPYNRFVHTVFGAGLAIGLQIACLMSPLWPFHPAGLIIVETTFLIVAWPSIFLGWAIKRLIIVYGGAKAYGLAKPVFLGLILGEVFAAIVWASVPAILIWLGGDAAEIGHIHF